MRKHTGEKPYQCDICQKFYQSASARASHRRIHFDERPYVCDVCGKAFKKVDYLIGHKKTHDPSSRRQCQYCDKTFIKLEHLRNHEMFHRNEKAFTCEVCGKGFIQKKYYTSHIKICGKPTAPPQIPVEQNSQESIEPIPQSSQLSHSIIEPVDIQSHDHIQILSDDLNLSRHHTLSQLQMQTSMEMT